MDTDVERRKAFEAFYSSLSPEERRGRLFLKPEFRDAYNELVEADRQFPVPTYLWEKWVPLLGVFPVAVYIELRRMCFVNRRRGRSATGAGHARKPSRSDSASGSGRPWARRSRS